MMPQKSCKHKRKHQISLILRTSPLFYHLCQITSHLSKMHYTHAEKIFKLVTSHNNDDDNDDNYINANDNYL